MTYNELINKIKKDVMDKDLVFAYVANPQKIERTILVNNLLKEFLPADHIRIYAKEDNANVAQMLSNLSGQIRYYTSADDQIIEFELMKNENEAVLLPYTKDEIDDLLNRAGAKRNILKRVLQANAYMPFESLSTEQIEAIEEQVRGTMVSVSDNPFKIRVRPEELRNIKTYDEVQSFLEKNYDDIINKINVEKTSVCQCVYVYHFTQEIMLSLVLSKSIFANFEVLFVIHSGQNDTAVDEVIEFLEKKGIKYRLISVDYSDVPEKFHFNIMKAIENENIKNDFEVIATSLEDENIRKNSPLYMVKNDAITHKNRLPIIGWLTSQEIKTVAEYVLNEK